MSQGNIDSGRKEGLSSNEREKLVRLRRDNRIEMVQRSSAYFAVERLTSVNTPSDWRDDLEGCLVSSAIHGD